MSKRKGNYRKEFEKEALQFMYLCSGRDRQILLKKYIKNNLSEYVRLASIAAVLEYKRLFLKISANVEEDMDSFLHGFEILNRNFELLENWVTDFIEKINNPQAKQLVYEYWAERKEKLDIENFCVQQLFKELP